MKIAYLLHEFPNKHHEVQNQKHIPKQRGLSCINALWEIKVVFTVFKDSHTYKSNSIGCIMLKVLITHFGKGCNDGLYIIKPFQKMEYLYYWKLYICFVELTTAYDHINRDFVFSLLRNHVPIFDSTGSDRGNISFHKVVHVW